MNEEKKEKVENSRELKKFNCFENLKRQKKNIGKVTNQNGTFEIFVTRTIVATHTWN